MRSRFFSMLGVLAALVPASCSSYTEDIGDGFLIRTRVYHGMGEDYKEYDLFHKGMLGIRRLIQKDISGAEVSPKGQRVLFFARRHRAEPLGMDEILYVFDRHTQDLIKVSEGEFDYTHDYWCPTGDRLVYRKYYEAIVLFDLATRQPREIAGTEYHFLGWSPSGQKVAYATGKSIYEVNSLHFTDVEDLQEIQVSEKQGEWRKEDFDWMTVDGEEQIVVKQVQK